MSSLYRNVCIELWWQRDGDWPGPVLCGGWLDVWHTAMAAPQTRVVPGQPPLASCFVCLVELKGTQRQPEGEVGPALREVAPPLAVLVLRVRRYGEGGAGTRTPTPQRPHLLLFPRRKLLMTHPCPRSTCHVHAQAFLDQTNYTHEAEELVLQARQVKAHSPGMPVAIYLDAVLAEPFQTAVGKAMRDPSMQDFFLRSANGPITCTVFCR